MDSEQLRLEIIEKLERLELQPETVKQLRALLPRFGGNALSVLYLLMRGTGNQARIAETLGISSPAVSKIINHNEQFKRFRDILLSGISDQGGGVSAFSRAVGWVPNRLSSEELRRNIGIAVEAFRLGTSEDASGFVFRIRDWHRMKNDVGETG